MIERGVIVAGAMLLLFGCLFILIGMWECDTRIERFWFYLGGLFIYAGLISIVLVV